MVEKDTIFSSTIKYNGIFSFKDFYKFCYEWINEEIGINVSETKYEEKIKGDTKDIVVEWEGEKEMTDYFRFDFKVRFEVSSLKNVEVSQNGLKISTNQGSIKISVKGVLARDYKGKFEMSAFKKFLRSVYEKWVIPSTISEYESKIVGACDEFLSQAKAYLDLEGKK
ncbi:MAG: hypothetical protein QXD05_01170 [Candidatus Pacearchaeota archaeon]